MPAEFAVRFLHSLSILPRELQRTGHTAPTCTELLGDIPAVPARLSENLEEIKLVQSMLDHAHRSLESKELIWGLH